jgi:cell volume regulation protein A
MEAIANLNLLILLGAALALAGILTSLAASRFGAPLLLVFLGLGMLAGEDGPLGLQFNDTAATYLVGTVALSLILFDGGLRTRLSTFRLALAPAVPLATLGVLVTGGLTGAAAHYWVGLSWPQALLVGAVVGSTDAAAVLFLLRAGGVQLSQRVGAVLEVESGLNDPMAVLLTLLLVGVVQSGSADPAEVMVFLLRQGVLGAAFGIGGGFLARYGLERLKLPAGLRPPLAAAYGVGIAAAAAVADGSGLLAAYLAGLVLGNRHVEGLASILDFSEALTWLAQIAMFLVIGLLVTPTQLLGQLEAGLIISAALAFVARPVAVWLCLIPFRFTWREKVFVSWVGLRGSVAVLLAAIPALAGLPDGQLYFNLAFIVVVSSLAVQGWSLRRVARALGLVLPGAAQPVRRAVLDLPGAPGSEIFAIEIDIGSPALERALPDWMRPLLLLRDGVLSVPGPVPELQAGDTLYLLAPPNREAALDRHFAIATDEAPLGAFSVEGSAELAALAAAYGSEAPNLPSGETVSDLFSATYGGFVGLGDRVRLGGLSLAAEAVEEGRVTRAAIDLEALPERRDAPRLLLRRARLSLRRLRPWRQRRRGLH